MKTPATKIVTRFYTADEGEFFDLGYGEALRLIREAQEDFETHDFHPHGFIAPAWLLGAEAERAVIDAGMSYTTTLRTVRDFDGDRTIPSQSLVYSVRSGLRRISSLAWNRSLFRRLTSNPLLRLGIHPPDIDHRAIWRQIGEIVSAGAPRSQGNDLSGFAHRHPERSRGIPRDDQTAGALSNHATGSLDCAPLRSE